MTTYYLDAYNVIHCSDPLRAIAAKSIDAARDAVINMLVEYCTLTDERIMLVFDGAGDPSTLANHPDRLGRLQIVYCESVISADAYIERAVFETENRLNVVVVTADRTLAQSARGMGALVLRPQSFVNQIQSTKAEFRTKRTAQKKNGFGIKLSERLNEQIRMELQMLRNDVGSQNTRSSDKGQVKKGRAGPKTGS